MRKFRTKRRTGWCAWLCAVCIILTLCGSAIEVYAAGTGSIYGSSASAERGEDVTVSFSLSGNPGIWGLKGSVSYDRAVMTLKSVSVGSVFSQSEVTTGEDLSQYPFVFLATGSTIENKTANGTLIKLTFSVSAEAQLTDYAVGISIPQAINADGQDVAVSASGAKVTVAKCLHRNTYLRNKVEATEETEGYSGDAYCAKCGVLVKKGATVPKVINTCEHANQIQTVIAEASCEAMGMVRHSCSDCGKELSDEDIPATGHKEAALTEWKAATTTEEGFTGNIYCEVCNQLLQEGTVIPKIPILVFNMVTQTEDTYLRTSQAGLVFVSDAALDTFVRVEVNGIILEEQSYLLESGSTKITLKPEYLESLSDGKHTVTIVSDAGTASAQFYVASAPEAPAEEPWKFTWGIQDTVMLIITVLSVAAAAGSIAYTVITDAKRNKKGRFSGNAEQ